MVSINYSAREVCCKIVYYGPGLSGKTTNLQYIHEKVPQDTRGKLISLATEADRTLYFDFLPINIGTINDFQAKFQLYTVPGQVYYNATRKLVLRGVDGVVFVADSQADKMDENIESLANLEENLVEYGYDPEELPMIIQYNKRDLPGVLSVGELNARLNQKGRPFFEASATLGNGVFDTLKLIIKVVLNKAKSSESGAAATAQPQAAAPSEAPSPAAMAPPHERVAVPAVQPKSDSAMNAPAVGAQTGTAVQAAPVMSPAPQVESESEPEPVQAANRPFPGNEASTVEERKAPPIGFGQSGSEESSKSSAVTGSEPKASENAAGLPSINSPQMAPSLRRRAEGKKRGFFKRLFGIK